MDFYIKNMVCDRCKMVVRQTFEDLGLSPDSVELGEVKLSQEPEPAQVNKIAEKLQSYGFELLDDKKNQIVEKIKNAVRELVHQHPDSLKKITSSVFIAEKVGKDYKYLSGLFSESEGTTIEQFLIEQKIERVKELLAYDELNLSQIADQLYYSSVQHLSTQFKKVTGLTPSSFKENRDKKRKTIDSI